MTAALSRLIVLGTISLAYYPVSEQSAVLGSIFPFFSVLSRFRFHYLIVSLELTQIPERSVPGNQDEDASEYAQLPASETT